MTDRIVVYGPEGSTYVRAVRMALDEKGLRHELRELPFADYKRAPYIAERHPFGKVPALEHESLRLYETQAIIRYIDEVWPEPPLQPDGARERARMNQIVGVVDSYLVPSLAFGIIFNRLFAPNMGLACDEHAVAAALPLAEVSVRALADLQHDRGPFLCGERPAIADIMVHPIMTCARLTPEGSRILQGHPRLDGWIDTMSAHLARRQAAAGASPR
ncbi:MAG TPA: glutathione S-transferase family protein [Allosphingosinicella sp.]